MNAPLTKTQSTPSWSQPGLLHETEQTPGGNREPSPGALPTLVHFVLSEEKNLFSLRRQQSGEKAQRLGERCVAQGHPRSPEVI